MYGPPAPEDDNVQILKKLALSHPLLTFVVFGGKSPPSCSLSLVNTEKRSQLFLCGHLREDLQLILSH